MRSWEVGEVRKHQDGKMILHFCSLLFSRFTGILLHEEAGTNVRLHTNAFTRKPFYTKTPSHTKNFGTQLLLHGDPVIHAPCYTQTLVHTLESKQLREL